MTFLRTPLGIENRGLFFDNSITVYVEMDSQLDPARAIDIAFWREFFRHYYPDVSITFSALGGKSHVLNASLRIVREDLKNVICVMDRDYDSLNDKIIDDHRVFYTYGYGVESDVLSYFSIPRILRSLAPGMPHIEQRTHDVIDLIQGTLDLDWYLLKSDQLGVKAGMSTLDRYNPSSDLNHDIKTLPVRLRRGPISRRIKALKNRRIKPLRQNSRPSAAHIVPAHHYFEICYHTLCRFISMVSRDNISKGHFLSVSIASIEGMFSIIRGPMKSHFDSTSGRDIHFKI